MLERLYVPSSRTAIDVAGVRTFGSSTRCTYAALERRVRSATPASPYVGPSSAPYACVQGRFGGGVDTEIPHPRPYFHAHQNEEPGGRGQAHRSCCTGPALAPTGERAMSTRTRRTGGTQAEVVIPLFARRDCGGRSGAPITSGESRLCQPGERPKTEETRDLLAQLPATPRARCRQDEPMRQDARQLAKRLAAVRWLLHCTRNRVEDLAETIEFLALKLAQLGAEERQLTAQLTELAPDDPTLRRLDPIVEAREADERRARRRGVR